MATVFVYEDGEIIFRDRITMEKYFRENTEDYLKYGARSKHLRSYAELALEIACGGDVNYYVNEIKKMFCKSVKDAISCSIVEWEEEEAKENFPDYKWYKEEEG